MIPQHKKENLSVAYVRAIAASAGVNIAKSENDYGFDLQLRGISAKLSGNKHHYCDNGLAIDIQLKCSENVSSSDLDVTYDLDARTFNMLADSSVHIPRILVVMQVPHSEGEWLLQSENELSIRHCAYWISLRGQELTSNNSSQRIKIPKNQKFTPLAISEMFLKIKDGDEL